MVCPQCKADNIEGSAFCDNCGMPLTNEVNTPAPVTPVTPPVPVSPAPMVDSSVSVPNANMPSAVPPVTPPASPAPVNPAPPMPVDIAPAASANRIKCSFCGVENDLANSFCENCGTPLTKGVSPTPISTDSSQSAPATLAASPTAPASTDSSGTVPVPIPPPAPVQPPAPAPFVKMIIPTPASQPPPTGHPRLVVVSSGMYFDLYGYQEVLIGRVDPTSNHFPEVDLTAHGGDEGGVSRKHLRLSLAGNQYFAEDLGSSNGSFISTTRLTPNTRTPLNNGDQLRLGKLVLNFFAQ